MNQQLEEIGDERLERRAARLHHQRVPVAVHNQSRQSVGLAVNQAVALIQNIHGFAPRQSTLEQTQQKIAPYLGLTITEHPHADFAARIHRCPAVVAPTSVMYWV